MKKPFKYRVSAKPTFLTQFNVYEVQRKGLIGWHTIADYRDLETAIAHKTRLEQL